MCRLQTLSEVIMGIMIHLMAIRFWLGIGKAGAMSATISTTSQCSNRLKYLPLASAASPLPNANAYRDSRMGSPMVNLTLSAIGISETRLLFRAPSGLREGFLTRDRSRHRPAAVRRAPVGADADGMGKRGV